MTKLYHLALSCIMMLVGFKCDAQTSINGVVKILQGGGVDMASVIVSPADAPKSFLASTFTENDGRYSLRFQSDCDSLLLKVSGLEIAPALITIPNKSGLYDIVVESKTIELKEVVVKSNKIYSQGDTINYNVASFLSQNDQALSDVLKKMPGITVSESGQVSYQGKPIKNFYIEGLDLMKGHYGIATNNIDPNNVATVQVLENHQDIKALEGLRPEEQASINIKLKEGVKGVFNLIATIGMGHGDDVLWNNSAMATFFKRNSQFIATYKTNNTGEDLSQELYSFDNDYSKTSEISSISMSSAPGIDKRFYNFNRSHSATFNNVYRVGNMGELGINTAYLNDRDSRKSYSNTANALPDGSMHDVDEQIEGTILTNKAYGDFSYLYNGEQKYLKDQLKIDWLSTDAHSHIFSGSDDVTQIGKSESYRLLNKFHLTNRTSEYKGYEVFSVLNFEKRPHNLSVNPNLFPEFIEGEMLYQCVNSRNLSTENRVGLLSALRIGRITIHPSLFVNYDYNGLTSSLVDSRNDLWLGIFSTGVGAELSWRMRRLDVSIYLPLSYKNFRRDRFPDAVTDKCSVRGEPRLHFIYKISSRHAISFKSELNYTMPSIRNLYSNYVLTSYRQLSAYDVSDLYEGMNIFNSVTYDFKNILAMRFVGIDLSWSYQKPNVLYGYYYNGLAERVISQRTGETSNMLSAKIRSSQGFNWRRLKIGLSATCSNNESPMLVQDHVLRYSGSMFGISGDISMTPLEWLSVSYEGNYYQSASRQRGFDRMPWIRTLRNNADFDLNFLGKVRLRTSIYHYYNNYNSGNKSFLLLNAEANYSLKRLLFTLSCTNLLNRKYYLYSSQSALTETRAIYNIRPRSVLLKIRFRIL